MFKCLKPKVKTYTAHLGEQRHTELLRKRCHSTEKPRQGLRRACRCGDLTGRPVRTGHWDRSCPHPTPGAVRGSWGLKPQPCSRPAAPQTPLRPHGNPEGHRGTRLGRAHQDLPLLLVLPLLLDLVKLLEELELGPDVTRLLVSVIVLQRWGRGRSGLGTPAGRSVSPTQPPPMAPPQT